MTRYWKWPHTLGDTSMMREANKLIEVANIAVCLTSSSDYIRGYKTRYEKQKVIEEDADDKLFVKHFRDGDTAIYSVLKWTSAASII